MKKIEKKSENLASKMEALPNTKLGKHVKWNAEKDEAILKYKDAKGIKAIAYILGVSPCTVAKRYNDLKTARK